MPEPLTTTSYDPNNRQLTFADKTLTYDDNGNLQSITDSNGTTLYSWNARNQLVGISGPTVNASFVYDGTGRREKKTINESLTEFLYDGINPVQESAGASILASVLPGLGIDEFLLWTDVVTGTTSALLADHLGSPIAIADNTGTVQTEYNYEAFGRSTVSGVQNSSSYQFTGRENDGTGLYYYRARYYHPALQRFVSEDPLGLAGNDVNTYAYVSNNPVRWFDPTGEAKKPGLPKRIECLAYYARVQLYCNNNACEDNDSCLMLILKIAIKRACITAQKHLTEECYPDDPTHKQRIPDQLNGIKRCEKLLETCNSCPAK
jgi:RHS repeat-associated protein